jgi:tetratricopeptide (TPR) repeat protein
MSPSPASKPAVFLVAVLCLLAVLASPRPAAAQRLGEDVATLHDRCVAFVRSNPKVGLERAKLWKDQGGGFAADHCIAMALFQLKDYVAAAKLFETLATAMLGMPVDQRTQALDQAGLAWLDAHEPERARAAFDGALALHGEDPDLLIDRAQALADLKRYWDAIDDLNRAIELAPKRADAYIYRGTAYRYVDARDLAAEDIDRGLALAPDSTMGLLERGNLRRLRGDAAGARQDWLRVTQLGPDSLEAKAAKINLGGLGAGDDAPPEAGPWRKKP